MLLKAPAGVEDFSTDEMEQREKFQALWNDGQSSAGYLGRYVKSDPARPNYVDPREQIPSTDPVPIPWNGFPKLLSRWYDDEASDHNRENAEAAADTLVPQLFWVQPNPRKPSELKIFSCAPHQIPFFVQALGQHVAQLARPRRTLKSDGSLGPELVEMHRQQDEYLEWHAQRDADGTLVSLTFTAEPPDYWQALWEISPDKVCSLYQSLVDTNITKAELEYPGDVVAAGVDQNGRFIWVRTGEQAGDYNPLNPWNMSRGIAHLTHPANTLGAEVNLAKDASVVLACDALPAPLPNQPAAEIRRIACGQYGGINRSSDPLIGLAVGDQVDNGAKVTLTDPVGLYIMRCDLSGLVSPDGQPMGDSALTIVRGQKDADFPRILRMKIQLPATAGFRLGQCKLGNRLLKRGGQIARLTTMGLYAQVYPGQAVGGATGCAAIPCRNPNHQNLFASSNKDAQGQDVCAGSDSPEWLIETPFEGAQQAPVHPLAAAAARVETSPMEIAQDVVPEKMPASRTPFKP